MSSDLTSTQLDSIQRLLSDPLREAVRGEMQAGQERLTAAIEKLADQLAAHVADCLRRDRARGVRLESLHMRLDALDRFRGKVLIVYGALTILLSFGWSLARDRLAALVRKP